ncbi:MAG: hypothetical protein RSO15_15435 [Bacteroides sp.]|uniref:plasmid mobilization protein n=1 Tax=Bacteroides sp. TaxID=29523 RepID=UPI002FCB04AE
MKEKKRKGRHPMQDILVKDTKVCFRLDVQELAELDRIVGNSGAKNRSEYIKAVVFSRAIRVSIVEEKRGEDWKTLNNLYSQYRKFGNNYNQVVKVLHTTFEEKKALALLYKLENLTIEFVNINKKIMGIISKIKER